MAFSINQVRHFYIANAYKTNVSSLVNAGDICVDADAAKTVLWFNYMSPGGLVSTDKIDISNVIYAKATPSGGMEHKLDRYEVTLDSSASATPVSGQDYLLRLALGQYIGLSQENQNFMYGEVNVRGNMTVSDFYKNMALSLAKNVNNDTTPVVNIYLVSAAAANTDVPVTATTKASSLSATDYSKIIIEQAEQPWVLGMMPEAYITFVPQFLPIVANGADVPWGKATKVTSTRTVGNGHNIADMEYFHIGARGDVYRGMGYPNIIKTTYLADPSLKYDTLDIHYAYVGSNESVQKSEKTITIAAEDDGSHTRMKAIITAINTATGLGIPNLS